MPDLSSMMEAATLQELPPRQICELARAVYNSLSGMWSPDCDAHHEARLCMLTLFDREVNRIPGRLDMFVSLCNAEHQERWQESNVHLDVLVYVML